MMEIPPEGSTENAGNNIKKNANSPSRGLRKGESKPRSRTLRALIAAALVWFLIIGPYVVYRLIVNLYRVIEAAPGLGTEKISTLGDIVTVVTIIGTQLASLWITVNRVSYRSRDILIILVPIYGWIWAGKIMWRIAYLPYVDWRPCPNEMENIEFIKIDGREEPVMRRKF
ncbi:hypothetical protein [Streptosporangium sp. NPDC000396]|uniref:hypothetical protein n=1 Tax=Streptosporangium sp. NPDC000396 TaxID=3366185 RepID=UPI003694DC76